MSSRRVAPWLPVAHQPCAMVLSLQVTDQALLLRVLVWLASTPLRGVTVGHACDIIVRGLGPTKRERLRVRTALRTMVDRGLLRVDAEGFVRAAWSDQDWAQLGPGTAQVGPGVGPGTAQVGPEYSPGSGTHSTPNTAESLNTDPLEIDRDHREERENARAAWSWESVLTLWSEVIGEALPKTEWRETCQSILVTYSEDQIRTACAQAKDDGYAHENGADPKHLARQMPAYLAKARGGGTRTTRANTRCNAPPDPTNDSIIYPTAHAAVGAA